jgi:hypothetical protein
VSETFTIPTDPSKADGLAGELGELATACEWKRAALVYARVQVRDRQGRPTDKATAGLLTPTEYALRGIHGLRSKTTTRAYWRAWGNAITEGLAQPVKLGDEVELPDAEWADYYQPAPVSEPYYVPPPPNTAGPLPTDDVNEYDGQDSWAYRSQRDDLGLGTCPPMASDIDEGEEPIGRPRQREPQPDPLPCPKPNPLARLWDDYLAWAEDHTETVLRIFREHHGAITIQDKGIAHERIERLRQTLNDIEAIVDREIRAASEGDA